MLESHNWKLWWKKLKNQWEEDNKPDQQDIILIVDDLKEKLQEEKAEASFKDKVLKVKIMDQVEKNYYEQE